MVIKLNRKRIFQVNLPDIEILWEIVITLKKKKEKKVILNIPEI